MSRPRVIFHVSHGFHKWFVFTKGDCDLADLRKFSKRATLFALFWSNFGRSDTGLDPELHRSFLVL